MKQIRNTTAKTEILKLINNSNRALSHSDIQENIGNLCNRVTIYRVLDRLEEEGYLHKIINMDGVVHYAKCSQCTKEHHHHHHHHLHFSCEKCRSVVCIENVVPKIKLPEGYVEYSYNFVISGLCPDCLGKSN